MKQSFDKVYSEISHIMADYPLEQILSVTDLTLLDVEATTESIETLVENGEKNHVAALCVLPEHLTYLTQSDIKKATVVNFPEGNHDIKLVLSTIHEIIDNNLADEIDYVFPYQVYLNGDSKTALKHCKTAYELCAAQGICFKVIIETGAFPSIDSIYQLSGKLVDIGCDFLKTSTGKIKQGATLEAAYAILLAIQNKSCGIKLSGGIRTFKQATQYALLAEHLLNKKIDNTWFRLGTSKIISLS